MVVSASGLSVGTYCLKLKKKGTPTPRGMGTSEDNSHSLYPDKEQRDSPFIRQSKKLCQFLYTLPLIPLTNVHLDPLHT